MNKDTKIKETGVKNKIASSGDSNDSNDSNDNVDSVNGIDNNYSYEEDTDSISDEDSNYDNYDNFHFLKPSAEEIEEENEIADILSNIDAQCRQLLSRKN